jgi:chemotaxis protein CheD
MSDAVPLDVFLPSGQFHFGGGNVRVLTLLGTCVAISIWHPVKRIGGMCHFLLPARRLNTAVDESMPGLYAEDVMELFAGALRATNTLPHEYIVKLAGGGNMFPDQLTPSACRDGGCTDARRSGCQSIGCKNIGVARTLLGGAGFAIASENVGGHGSRQVIFELWSGEVWVRRGAAMSAGSQVAA